MRKRVSVAVAAMAACFAYQAFGLHVYWIGGSSGEWNTGSNWTGGKAPYTANYFVHITNETPVSITVTGGTTIGGIEFSGADHTVSSGSTIYIRTGETGDPRVEVAEGVTATVGILYPVTGGENGLHKRGKGKLVTKSFLGHSTRHFSYLDVEEGEIRHETGGDSVNVGGRMYIRSGATFTCGTDNLLQNNTVVYLEKGAVYDGNGRRDTLGGFAGEGTVRNLSTGTATTMTAGPLVFSGDLHGKIGIIPTSATVTGEDGGYFCVGSANALADASVEIGGDAAYTNVLRFAPGVETYYVKSLTSTRPEAPVILEDTNGAPVRVSVGFPTTLSTAYFAGCGDLAKTGANAYQLTGNNFAATGALSVEQGLVSAGTGTAGGDATGLAGASGLEVRSGTTFVMQNAADTVWGEGLKVSGDGAIQLAGPGSWSIGDFSVDGGSLSILSGASGQTLTLAGGESRPASFTINPDNFSVVISGGHHVFPGTLNCQKNHTFLQTGGFVECLLQSQGVNCNNDIFYTMTGGHMISLANQAKGQYPQGIGLDLSGDAVAELRSDSDFRHRLCSGGKAHTIRLRDNAYLGIDYLQLGEYTCDATGTIQLDGGVLGVRNWIGCPSGMTDASPLYVNVLFNGGVLRSESADGNQSWSSYDDKGHITGKVQAGGAKIDVPRAQLGSGLTLTWPLVSDVAEGADGGLLKTGVGSLTLTRKCEITGPLDVVDGQLVSTCANAGELAFGSGDVTVREAELSLQGGVATTLCSAPGAKLSYAECASLAVKDGADVTIGAAGAAADTVLCRAGHGVLTVSAGSNNKRLNASSTIKVNGGLALDSATGLPKAPIYERCWISGGNAMTVRRHRFLTLDGENRLVPASAVAFNPSTSTSATVAEITGAPVTVSENASVGALDVEYLNGSTGSGGLTIANGKTLTIGSGEAGSVASLLINNTYATSAGLASVLGGTISFGAAEGVILLNNDYSKETPTKITSSITGTGGLVIAAPLKPTAGHHNGYVSLSAVNPYSGGTWIEGAIVRADKAGCLGTGAVHVSGTEADGGALYVYGTYDSSEFSNPLELSGFGPDGNGPASQVASALKGALIVKRPISLTGGIALAADAKIAVAGNALATPVTADSAITGPGALVLQGPGALRLTVANAYAGGTRIESGVLEVADAGTLGTGPVEVCEGAVLRFLNSGAKTVSNVITGAGTIECNGAAVTFEHSEGFAGAMTGAGSATGDEGYVKTGDGRTVFTSEATYSGDTRIDAGTLQLGIRTPAAAPAADAIAFRLDASAEGTLTTSGDKVVSWSDADGRAIAFANEAEHAPTLNGEGQADKPTVRFAGNSLERLIANAPVARLRTLVMVNRVASGSHPNPSGWGNAGIYGECDQDVGFRLYNQTNVKVDSLFEDGILYVNGVSGMSRMGNLDYMAFPNNQFNTLMAVASDDRTVTAGTIGDYSKNWKRAYCGDIAEMIAYDRELSEVERLEVERYLASKWSVRELPGAACTNLLPTETSVTVAAGATLDLADGYQEIAALFGEGTVANGGTGCATLVLTSGTSVFTGSVSGKVCLEVAEGATLDLGGGTLTVYAVGGAGQIVNGTVVVTGEIRPGGEGAVGTLTFGTAPVVDGATLVVDGDRTAGTVDGVAVASGVLDVSGLALSVPVRAAIPRGRHDLLVAPDGVTGTFSATDLPDNNRWSVTYSDTAVSLERNSGTLIIVK